MVAIQKQAMANHLRTLQNWQKKEEKGKGKKKEKEKKRGIKCLAND